MWRKRATPAPAFKVPAAYNAIDAEYAPLGVPGQVPICAMMQIAESDTHDDYVVCRGFDPDSGRFLDSVNVGKPYGARGTNPYTVGKMYPAVKPVTKLGTTPGVAATSTGHPADLDETVEILKDDDDNPIWWLMLDAGVSSDNEVVTVYMDGGVAGDSLEDCTFTYTIKNLAGDELDTGLTPHRSRYPKTTYTQAPDGSYGLASQISGSWVLLVAWQEIEQTDACTT